MPQPSLISGVAGEVHSTAYQGPLLGDQLVAMAEAFTRVKQAEKAQALEKFKVMMATADKLPLDASALRKTAKKAGIPLASDEEIAAIAAAGKAERTSSGAAPAQASTGTPQASTQQQQPDAAVAAAQKKWQDGMTPQKGLQYVLDTWYQQGRQLANQEFRSKMAKLEADEASSTFDKVASTQKLKAGSGDAKAMGWMMATGVVPFNATQLAWSNASPELRNKAYEIALGYDEGQNFRALLNAGKSVKDAYSLSHTISMGQPMTPEQQKAAAGMSPKEIGDEAEAMTSLYKAGVSQEQLTTVMNKARETGDLVGALPSKLQPIIGQQLELQRKETELTGQRLGVEQTRAESEKVRAQTAEEREQRLASESLWKRRAQFAKLQLMWANGQNTEIIKAFNAAVAAKKNGIELKPEDTQKLLDQLHSLDPKIFDEPQDLLDYASGLQQPSTLPGDNPLEDELGDTTSKIPKPSAGKK